MFYLIKLVNSNTVCCINNVRRRYSAVDIDVATSTDYEPQMNSNNALVDKTVEPTVNLDSFTKQISPVLEPNLSTNEPLSSISSQVDMSSNNVQVHCSTQPS